MKSHQKIFPVLAGACLSLLVNTPLQAQTGAADAHQHGHDDHAASALSLNQGKKWQTDAPLRKGMQSINVAVMDSVAEFHHGTLSKPDAEKLVEHINGQVNYLVVNCKLEPQADATLHVLIGDLLSGADALSKQPLSNQGLPRIINVLQLYPDYFDHPGWQEIEHN